MKSIFRKLIAASCCLILTIGFGHELHAAEKKGKKSKKAEQQRKRSEQKKANKLEQRKRSEKKKASKLAALNKALSVGVVPSELFSSDMVLQRDLIVPIWGKGKPGESVSISFADQTVNGKVDSKGDWLLKLQPLKTSKVGSDLVIKSRNTITYTNVVVGEVWVCSGQSNMAVRFNSKRKIDPEYFKLDLSNFRVVGTGTGKGWKVLSENTQGHVSKVGFYFGIDLYKNIDAPIGVVLAAASTTPIQAWMPEDENERIRKKYGIREDWNGDDAPTARSVYKSASQFNMKITKVAPMAMRGVIWYQGERNAKTSMGWEYRWLLTELISIWRNYWAAQADEPMRKFPFYYVQVPVQSGVQWVKLRDAMRRALDLSENVGMAVFYDWGPSIHPHNLQPAGARLALWALAKDYGKDIVYSGPLLDKIKYQGGKAIVSFKHVGGGLKSKDGSAELKFFEIAGADGKYVDAKAVIKGDTVVVSSPEVASPAGVRYLFIKRPADPTVSLINAEGLPASPFMTDDSKP